MPRNQRWTGSCLSVLAGLIAVEARAQITAVVVSGKGHRSAAWFNPHLPPVDGALVADAGPDQVGTTC